MARLGEFPCMVVLRMMGLGLGGWAGSIRTGRKRVRGRLHKCWRVWFLHVPTGTEDPTPRRGSSRCPALPLSPGDATRSPVSSDGHSTSLFVCASKGPVT